MLRRLEKRILVDLPSLEARCSMFHCHLPAIVSSPPLQITCQINYEEVAKVLLGFILLLQCMQTRLKSMLVCAYVADNRGLLWV